MDLFRREIGSAVEGQQVLPLEKNERLQGLAALKWTKNTGEGGTQLLGRDVIENGAHLGVARDVFEPKNPFEIEGVVLPLVLEGQKGRGFQGKQSEAGHEGIGQGDFNRSRAMIGHFAEFAAKDPIKAIGGQMLSFL